LPNLEFERSDFFIADIHFLGLFMAEKHDLSDKKTVCHALLPV
jgi:hypothetical protein